MRQITTLLVSLTILSTIAACAAEHHESNQAGQTTHSDFDVTDQSGGQPGSVELRGSMATVDGRPANAIGLRRWTGRNLKGAALKVTDPKTAQFSSRLTPADLKELEAAKAAGGFVQFGCTQNLHQITLGRKLLRYEDGPELDLHVDLAIFCDDVSFSAEKIKIVASQVVMIDARVKLSGTSSTSFTLLSGELRLLGLNVLTAKGGDNLAPFGAPGLNLATNLITGLGRLNLDVTGSDLIKTEAKP